MSKGRVEGVQRARAFAALAVMLSHAANDIATHAGFQPIAFAQIGAAGVDLFFIVSGFVMVHSAARLFGSPGARRMFITRRLWRIVPLYWAATIVYVLMQVARGHGSALNVAFLAASMMFLPVANQSGSTIPVYGIGWTLDYEMFFYACFALGLGLTYRRGVSAIAASLLVCVALNTVLVLPQPFRFWTHPILLEFIFGLALAVLFRRGVRLGRWLSGVAMAVGLIALAGEAVCGISFSPDAPGQASLRWLFWGVPCALCFAGMVMQRGASRHPRPVIASIGEASYALYLIHPLVIILMRPVFFGLQAALGGNALLAGLTQFGLDGAIAVAGAIAVHRGVERPLLRMSQGWPPVAAGSAAPWT